MSGGEISAVQWRTSTGLSLPSTPLKNVDVERDRLSRSGILVCETEYGVPFLDVTIEDRAIEDRNAAVAQGEPKVASHVGRSSVARNLFAYKSVNEAWLKKTAKVLFVQGGAHRIATEVESDIKIVHRIQLLARNAYVAENVEIGRTGQIVSASVGGAITVLGLGATAAELAQQTRAYRSGGKKVSAAKSAQDTYKLAQTHLDATVASQREMIQNAKMEVQKLEATRILGEGMQSQAKRSIAFTSAVGITELAELTASSLDLATAISPSLEHASVISSAATGIGLVNAMVCLPLQGYQLYSNLVTMDEHLATKKAAEKLCEEYGVNKGADPELEIIGNLVKERQAYKGKGFTAGMSAMKILGAVTGLVAAAGGLVAATGTVAATAFAVMTPIGWTISAAATLGLIGYGLYKVGKYIHRRLEIRELNKFAVHTSALADPNNLPKLSDKQENRLNALRQKAVNELIVELDRAPTTEEIESKVHVEIIERLLKVDAEFAAQVLFVRFKESVLEYAASKEILVDELTKEDFLAAGGGAEFLVKMNRFDLNMLKAIAHADANNPKDAVTLIKKRLHI